MEFLGKIYLNGPDSKNSYNKHTRRALMRKAINVGVLLNDIRLVWFIFSVIFLTDSIFSVFKFTVS